MGTGSFARVLLWYSMLEIVHVRVALVVGGLGMFLAVFASGVVNDANRHIVGPIGFIGLALAVASALTVALTWALAPCRGDDGRG